jgi:gliding motility-associated transport system permease protein
MIRAIAARELKSLFASPLAWVVLAILQVMLAWVFLGRLDGYLKVQPQLLQIVNAPGITEFIAAPVFATAAVLFLMVVPLLTMRLIAEERRNRTLTLLFSAPVSMTEIILGKYLGIMLFLLAAIALVALMPLSLLSGGKLDFGLLAANLLGIVLLTAGFAALGLFVSSLTAHPAVAAIGGFGAAFAFWIMDLAAPDAEGPLSALSLLRHYESFSNGLLDSYDVVYYLLFIVMFLALAIRRLDAERLRG